MILKYMPKKVAFLYKKSKTMLKKNKLGTLALAGVKTNRRD